MPVYHYDEETKEFLYEEEAHIDPLETELKGENVYLLPASATFEKPLEAKEGFKVVFDGGKWSLVEIPQSEEELIPEYRPTKEEIQALRSEAYKAEVDPITCHINRLRDEEATTNELEAEIRALIEERKDKVEEIKQRYPYPAEPIEEIDELPVVEENSVTVSEMETVDIVD